MLFFAKKLLPDYLINSANIDSYEKRKSSLFRIFSQIFASFAKNQVYVNMNRINTKRRMAILCKWHGRLARGFFIHNEDHAIRGPVRRDRKEEHQWQMNQQKTLPLALTLLRTITTQKARPFKLTLDARRSTIARSKEQYLDGTI